MQGDAIGWESCDRDVVLRGEESIITRNRKLDLRTHARTVACTECPVERDSRGHGLVTQPPRCIQSSTNQVTGQDAYNVVGSTRNVTRNTPHARSVHSEVLTANGLRLSSGLARPSLRYRDIDLGAGKI